jgi:hypothetical protein
MDDFLKFLPIVLYLLYRAFAPSKKKEQKPKQRPMRPKNPPRQSPNLEDILRELTGETKATEPEPEFVEVPTPKSKSRSREKLEFEDHQYDFRPEYEHHADTGKDLKEIKQEIKEEKGISTPVASEVDLRQAIIYDAILNKPYS